MQSPSRARRAEGRQRPLLADTIGISLCLRQSRTENPRPFRHPPPPPLEKTFISTSLSVTSKIDRSGKSTGSSSASNETLTAESESHDAASRYTSDRSGSNISNRFSPYGRIVSRSGNASVEDVERLATQHGLASHMGVLDPSYHIYVNEDRTGGLCFKVSNKVAILMGDPMCEASRTAGLLNEFAQYRRQRRWDLSVLGNGEGLVRYAKDNKKRWTIIQFGKERVLNPLTNEVIHETSGKRILTQNRQLLNPSKGGITLDIYTPSQEEADYKLESELGTVYDEWRMARNMSGRLQAFITVYDPFLMPVLMTYIYSRGPDGRVNGFAALRWIGGKRGYHVDPCIAAPGAPKGISDLLLFASMAWLRQVGVSYLSFGYEPLDSLAEIWGMPAHVARLTHRIYRYTSQRLSISGKRTYLQKFKPDSAQDSAVHVMFPSRIPKPRHVVAMAHAANFSIRRLLFNDTRR